MSMSSDVRLCTDVVVQFTRSLDVYDRMQYDSMPVVASRGSGRAPVSFWGRRHVLCAVSSVPLVA